MTTEHIEIPPLPELTEFTAVDYTQSVLYAGSGLTEDQANDYGRDCYEAGLRARPASEAPAGLPLTQEPKYTVNGSAIVNRASGETIPADEPVFIFRARDKYAADVIGDYAAQFCTDPVHAAAVEARFIQFSEWAEAHPDRMKEPDSAIPPSAEAPNAGERAAFERVMMEQGANLERAPQDPTIPDDYVNPCTQSAWEGWQYRAALTQSPAPQAEAAEPVSTSAADGQAVALNTHVIYDCLSHDAKRRTSWENVEDVLSAVRTRHGPLYTHPSPQVSPSQDDWKPAANSAGPFADQSPRWQPPEASQDGGENGLISDREFIRIFHEGRHGSDKPCGVLRGIRAVIAAYELATPGPRGENAGGVRKLTDAELRAAWEACDETGYLEWSAVVMRACATAWGLRIAEKGE